MPKVSVIIPVYNEEKYLQQCLESVCGQTLQNIEIICVDDGSADNSVAILQQMQKEDKRIQIYTQKNSGAGTARNLGMKYAKGKYLSFLDSDDIFEPNMLENMVQAAEKENTDVLVCRSDEFDTATGASIVTPWTIKKEFLPEFFPFASKDVKKNFFEVFVWWPWDKLFRKSFIDSLGIKFQSLRTTNDLFFVCSAILMALRISYIDDVLVHQRVGVKSSLSRTREKSWDNFYKALMVLKQFMMGKNLYSRFEQDFVNYCLNFSRWHLDTIEGDSYVLLYQALKDKWLREFAVTSHTEEYFYQPWNYQWAQQIQQETPLEYLFSRIHGLEKERNRIYYDYEAMSHSLSFQVGRKITWLPRKIRDGLKGRK